MGITAWRLPLLIYTYFADIYLFKTFKKILTFRNYQCSKYVAMNFVKSWPFRVDKSCFLNKLAIHLIILRSAFWCLKSKGLWQMAWTFPFTNGCRYLHGSSATTIVCNRHSANDVEKELSYLAHLALSTKITQLYNRLL